MIGHMRHGSPPRLMALQSILSPNRRESLPTPSAGVRITAQERLTHPQPNMLTRVWTWTTRPEARVDIEAVRILMNRRQALGPAQDLGRNIGTEGGHGLVAAIHDPQIDLALIPVGLEHQVLVIAFQAHDGVRLARLQPANGRDHARAIGASIDVVAEEHDRAIASRAMLFDLGQQGRQQVEAAVDVADGVSQRRACTHGSRFFLAHAGQASAFGECGLQLANPGCPWAVPAPLPSDREISGRWLLLAPALPTRTGSAIRRCPTIKQR